LFIERRVLIGCAISGEESWAVDLDAQTFRDNALSIYGAERSPIIVHGLKRIWEHLGLTPATDAAIIQDTKLMAYLLDPDSGEHPSGLTLAYLAHRYAGMVYPYGIINSYESGIQAFREMLAYDARLILQLSQILPRQMPADTRKLYRHVELPLMAVLAKMHHDGIGVDGNACALERDRIQGEMDKLEKQMGVGNQLNLNSDREIIRFLLSQGVKFTKEFVYARGQTLMSALEEIAYQYPVVQAILDWRSLSRDHGFLEQAAGHNRLHPKWGQTRSGTSRIYASKPAVQNVSRDLRHLFVPGPGHVLIKADYSQAQMRILADLSGDEELNRFFHDGGDAHVRTAEWLGIDRDSAKQVNFGICFGISAVGLAARINQLRRDQGLLPIDAAAAETYIDTFYVRYPRVKEFFDAEWQRLKRTPQSQRVVKSPLGRIRRFDTRATRAIERKFRVTVPQQIEADLIKNAMVRLHRIFHSRNMEARIVMAIHDALWVEAPKKDEAEVRHLVRRIMETAGRPWLRIRMAVSLSWETM
jgi:DNA polymerase-1